MNKLTLIVSSILLFSITIGASATHKLLANQCTLTQTAGAPLRLTSAGTCTFKMSSTMHVSLEQVNIPAPFTKGFAYRGLLCTATMNSTHANTTVTFGNDWNVGYNHDLFKAHARSADDWNKSFKIEFKNNYLQGGTIAKTQDAFDVPYNSFDPLDNGFTTITCYIV